MTCASCVQTIEKATRKMVGVTESNVNLATEKLVIRYVPQLVTVSDVIRVVANAGYEAREDQESADSQDT
ncbi:heavy metal-associated domain-containing protein, partial [Enterococcus faecium]|uniref:cation transporter n=1 Tax=Enterococcus faecium TaxID=1352 RepID=UPI00396EC635